MISPDMANSCIQATGGVKDFCLGSHQPSYCFFSIFCGAQDGEVFPAFFCPMERVSTWCDVHNLNKCALSLFCFRFPLCLCCVLFNTPVLRDEPTICKPSDYG